MYARNICYKKVEQLIFLNEYNFYNLYLNVLLGILSKRK